MKEKLTKKVGPLPVWGWAIVGVAGVIFYLRYRASQSSPTASASGPLTSASVPFATTGGSANGTGTTAAGTANGYGGSLSDQIGTLTQDISALQGLNTVLGLGASGSPTAPPTAGTGPVYGPTTGGRYVPTTSTQDVLNAANAGLPIYYQPTPGGPFVQIPAGEIFPGSGYTSTFLFEPTPGGSNVPTQPGSTVTATNSSGGLISGGNPAPIQPQWQQRNALPLTAGGSRSNPLAA